MRYERTLVILGMLIAALSMGGSAWADFGMAPGWPLDWGTLPIMAPLDTSGAAKVDGVSQSTWDLPVSSSAIAVNISDVSPMPWVAYDARPVPLVGSDLPESHATIATVPVMPSMPLVETPHDRSMRAIEVPNGATVLLDGTSVAGGTGFGSGSFGQFEQPDPPEWDMGTSMFMAPILSGQ